MTDNHTKQEFTTDEITLRCSRCERPITPAEAIQTPTGYRCPECVKQQQKVFTTSQPIDYILGFILAAGLSFLGSLLSARIGFFTILLAPAAGVGIAEVIRFVTQKRRGPLLFRLVNIGIILGGVPLIALNVISLVFSLSTGTVNFFAFLPLGYQILYLVMVVPSAYYRLSGNLRR